MTQPTPYNRQFSFTNDQTSNPSTKTPGNQLDAEFNAVLTTFSQVLANLVLIQRDDGQLGNQTVGAAQLKPELSGGVAPATQWATATAYGLNTTVFNGLKLYRCIIAHISGVFATDLAAGDWTLLSDFSTAITSQTAGVVSLGGLTGTFTIPGGGLGSTVLPVARYDASQSLTSGQQLQLANNSLVPSGAGAQSLTSGQQLQAANNILVVCAAGAQSLSAGQQVQAASNISVPSGAGAQTLATGVQLQAANNILVVCAAGAQSLSTGQQLQAANNMGVPSVAGAQSFNSAQQLQAAANIATVTASGAQSYSAAQQNQIQSNIGLPAIMRSYLAGLTLSTAGSSATFSVAAGVAADSTNVDTMTLGSAISKTTGAWAVGTNNGALDTGAIANSTWYHVYEIKRPDTGVVDVLVSLSATTPTMPANYTLKRRIGAMRTNGSAQWVLFVQLGDTFLWSAEDGGGAAFANGAIGTAATSLTSTVPTGLQVEALIRLQMTSPSGTTNVLVSSLDQSDQAASVAISVSATGTSAAAAGEFQVRTNTSGQVRARSSAASTTIFGTTKGWIDRRGRDA